MQIAIIDFARDVLGMADANSAEIDTSPTQPVIDILPEQKDVTDMGGTMRLGQYPCTLNPESKAYSLYGASMIYARHRHRDEVNKTPQKQSRPVPSGIQESPQPPAPAVPRFRHRCRSAYEQQEISAINMPNTPMTRKSHRGVFA